MKDKKELSKSVMSEIKDKKVSIRSKHVVLAEKLLLGGSLALAVVIAVIQFNLVFYWFKITGNLSFLHFGGLGFLAFFRSFPYLWLVLGIVFFVLAAFLLKKYDISYKKPYVWLIVLIFITSLLIAGAFVSSGFNERLDERAIKGKNPLLKPFWGRDIRTANRNAIFGEIIKVEDKSFYVEVKDRDIEINYDQKTRFPNGDDFEKGDWIRVVGEYRGDDQFQAKGIIILDDRFKERGKRFKHNLLSKPRFR